MSVDMEKMRKDFEGRQKGGDFVQFEAGETLVYIHPPCREGDEFEPTAGLNYIPVTVHYGVGKNNGMAVSLDPEVNPIIEHPFIKKILKARKVKLTGECPLAKALADGTLDDEAADQARAQTRYMWGMTPLKFRTKSTLPWTDLSAKPSVGFIGKQIFDGIMEQFFDHGDITDPGDAVLLRIIRKGKDRNTKYEVRAEPATVKKHWVAPKPFKALLEKAMTEGGDCDLFRIVGNMIKSPAEVEAMIEGVKVGSDPEDFDEDEAPKKGAKSKKSVDEDDEEEDDEDDEEEAPPKKSAKPPAKSSKKVVEEGDDDEEEEDDEDEPPPKKAATKPAKKPVDDDEDDEEEDDEEPPPKKATKPAAKKPPADEDDDDEDDEDDEDEPPPKKPATKAAKKPAVEDDDEDDDEEPPPKKSAAKPAKKPAKDEDDEDDEEEAPPPKKAATKPAAKPDKSKKAPVEEDEEDDEDLEMEDLKSALDDLDDDEDDEEEEKPAKKSKK